MMASATAADPRSWTDAHLHAWDAAVLGAPWFAQAPQFAGRFDVARYIAEGGVCGGVVFVEADMAPADRVREAELFAQWGREAGFPFATVAGIEPGVAGFAAEHDALARVRGVSGARRVLHGGDIAFATARFAEDLREIGHGGRSFDFCVRWTDLPLVEQQARATTPMALILDHLGNPPIRCGWSSPERAEWQRLVARVAACERVSVKWSAMFENAGRALGAAEIRPWFEWCLACFGPTRLMWGSNWPVCFAPGSSAQLTQWIDACATIAGELGADEQAAILGGNARRLYRCQDGARHQPGR
jgi:L-fuconolactonase